MDLGAILLAGGRATRVGGAAKPMFAVGQHTLLDAAVAAATAAGAAPITVVAPVLDDSLPVRWVREDPPFTGPAAATVAALASWSTDPEWTLLLACDQPRVQDAVAVLLADASLVPADTDGICLADAAARPQWLTGLYRTAALRAGASTVDDEARNAPVRSLMTDLAIAVITRADLTDDVDTWDDLERARAKARAQEAQ